MRAKTTKKEINSRFNHIFSIDADLLPNLLYFNPSFAYSTRVEGWACDYYEFNDICFCSGYSPIGKNVDRETQKKYEARAKKIIQSTFFKKETKNKKINLLLTEFTNELIKN